MVEFDAAGARCRLKKSRRTEVALRRHRALFLRCRRGRHRPPDPAQRPRRTRNHRCQSRLPGARRPPGRDHGARLWPGSTPAPTIPARSRAVHRHHRKAPGPEGGLSRGARLAPALDRRRGAGRNSPKAMPRPATVAICLVCCKGRCIDESHPAGHSRGVLLLEPKVYSAMSVVSFSRVTTRGLLLPPPACCP